MTHDTAHWKAIAARIERAPTPIFVGSLENDPDRVMVPDTKPYPCESCREPVMLSPATLQRYTPQHCVMCADCMQAVIKHTDKPMHLIDPSPEQQAERAAGLANTPTLAVRCAHCPQTFDIPNGAAVVVGTAMLCTRCNGWSAIESPAVQSPLPNAERQRIIAKIPGPMVKQLNAFINDPSQNMAVFFGADVDLPMVYHTENDAEPTDADCPVCGFTVSVPAFSAPENPGAAAVIICGGCQQWLQTRDGKTVAVAPAGMIEQFKRLAPHACDALEAQAATDAKRVKH